MNILLCSKEAMAACPDKGICERLGEARFAEGSECHKFNEEIAAGASPRPTIRKENKPMTNLKETVDMMLSQDYKERFKAEYWQTKIRYEKLKNLNTKIEAALISGPDLKKRVPEPAHDCPLPLLREQQRVMGEYLHQLELRAAFESIEL